MKRREGGLKGIATYWTRKIARFTMSTEIIVFEEGEMFGKLCETLDVEIAKKHIDWLVEYLQDDMEDFSEAIFALFDAVRGLEGDDGPQRGARLAEICEVLLSKLEGDERAVFVNAFTMEALSQGVVEVLEYLEADDPQNYLEVLRASITEGTPHVMYFLHEWVLERDPCLLPSIFEEQRNSGMWHFEDEGYFFNLFIEYGFRRASAVPTKHRKELVQKIGAILDEYTAVIKENDYRVCMDTLMKLM